jgi:hypothetical protein
MGPLGRQPLWVKTRRRRAHLNAPAEPPKADILLRCSEWRDGSNPQYQASALRK